MKLMIPVICKDPTLVTDVRYMEILGLFLFKNLGVSHIF
jgi:hypothetical protein